MSFHLRDGFYFTRDGDEVVIRHDVLAVHAGAETRVPANEWASAVAATTKRGETGETYREALALLEADG